MAANSWKQITVVIHILSLLTIDLFLKLCENTKISFLINPTAQVLSAIVNEKYKFNSIYESTGRTQWIRLPELRALIVLEYCVYFISLNTLCDEAALVFHFLEILQSGVTGGSTIKRCFPWHPVKMQLLLHFAFYHTCKCNAGVENFTKCIIWC